jgi:hypothetical protein
MQLLPLSIPDFVVSFINEMRLDPRISTKPSLRQGVAILDLLLARFFRNEKLLINDLVTSAVRTTYYEEQSVAREIALNLVKKALNDAIVDQENQPVSNLRLAEVIRINTALQNYLKDEKVLEELFKRDLANVEDLRELVDLVFETRKGDLNLNDLKYFNAAERLEEYQGQMNGRDEIYAQSMLEQEGWQEDLLKLAQNNPEEFPSVMKNLRELGVEQSKLEPILKEAVEKLDDFDKYNQILTESSLYAPPPEAALDKITSNQIHDKLKMAQELDQRFFAYKSEITKQMIQNFQKRDLKLDFKEIMDGFIEHTSWEKMAEEYFKEKRINQTFNEIMEMQQQIREKLGNNSNQKFQKFMKKQMEENFNQALQQLETKEELQNLTQLMQELGNEIDKDQLFEKAEELNMDPSELQPYLRNKEEQISQMIQKNLDDFDQYTQQLQNFPLDKASMSNFISKGLQQKLPSILGALGHKNLQLTSEILDREAEPAHLDLLVEGLARGSGTNLLKQWFEFKNTIPTSVKQALNRLMNDTLLGMAENLAKTQFGFISKGQIIETNEIRHYIEGDSVDIVDLEETIVNLIDNGKNLDTISENDLICHTQKQGRIKVVIVLDSSGSMRGEKMTMGALASCILLYLLKQQDVCIIVFAGDTTILKRFDDSPPIENIATQLLNYEAKGGTQIEETLKYLSEQAEQLESGQILFTFFFSDFAFYENEREIEKIVQKMSHFELRIHALSNETPDVKMVNIFRRYLQFTETQVSSVHHLPRLMADILYNLH